MCERSIVVISLHDASPAEDHRSTGINGAIHATGESLRGDSAFFSEPTNIELAARTPTIVGYP